MGDVIQFKPRKVKWFSGIGSCDECGATWIQHLKEKDYDEYLKGKIGICPYCHEVAAHYCMRCE